MHPSFFSLSLRRVWLPAIAVLLAACGGSGGPDPAADASSPAAQAAPAALAALAPQDRSLSPREQLGKLIFDDQNLSNPQGTGCVACHRPALGWADNHGSNTGVAHGSTPRSLGLRNTLANGYSAQIPPFAFVTKNGQTEAVGGHFWDGRADTLALQALGPFLNTLEMNNPSAKAVVAKIAAAPYATLFTQEFGVSVLSTPDQAFSQIGVALEAFERARPLQPFNSKYDAMVRGNAVFDAPEQRGMALFMDRTRANCAGCHQMNPASGKPQDSLFSDFSYYALGIPRNQAIPRNADAGFFDLGLCGPQRTPPATPPGVNIEDFCGKFRMPTLRNVALRQRYMHNGFFSDLREVVSFYATRASNPTRWYGASGIPNDLPPTYRANIVSDRAPFNRKASDGPLLTPTEIDDLVAFLHTLSDGFSTP